MKSRIREWPGFVVAFALCFAVAAIGGAVTVPALPAWYAGLGKPSWNPPNFIFGPAWTILYILMALAGGLIWRERTRPGAPVAIWLFLIQLVLNLGWTLLFFGARQPALASWEILVLDASVAALIVAAWPLSKPAAALLVPYLAWILFASALCLEIWRLNS